jgi:hypothetical protein
MTTLSSDQKKQSRSFKQLSILVVTSAALLATTWWMASHPPGPGSQNDSFLVFAFGGVVSMLMAAGIMHHASTVTSSHTARDADHQREPSPMASKVRTSEPVEFTGFYSGGAVSMKPLVDLMGKFSDRNENIPLVLLVSRNERLEFKAGWYCSPTVGLALADQLNASPKHDDTRQCMVKVAERFMPAVAVPFVTRAGTATLLILQPEETVLDLARDAFKRELSDQLPILVHSLAQALEAQADMARLNMALSPTERPRMISVCCICNRIEQAEAKWTLLPGLDSPPAPGIAFSHSMCPDCFARYYPSS